MNRRAPSERISGRLEQRLPDTKRSGLTATSTYCLAKIQTLSPISRVAFVNSVRLRDLAMGRIAIDPWYTYLGVYLAYKESSTNDAIMRFLAPTLMPYRVDN